MNLVHTRKGSSFLIKLVSRFSALGSARDKVVSSANKMLSSSVEYDKSLMKMRKSKGANTEP